MICNIIKLCVYMLIFVILFLFVGANNHGFIWMNTKYLNGKQTRRNNYLPWLKVTHLYCINLISKYSSLVSCIPWFSQGAVCLERDFFLDLPIKEDTLITKSSESVFIFEEIWNNLRNFIYSCFKVEIQNIIVWL